MSQIKIFDVHGRGIPGINIRLSVGTEDSEAAIFDYSTNDDGTQTWPIPFWPVRDYTLHINKRYVQPAYEQMDVYVERPPSGNFGDIVIELKSASHSPTPTTDPMAPLTIDGPVFRQFGAIWRWVGCDAFVLPQRHAVGEDIDPFLDWAQLTGFNLLRCFVAMAIVPPKVGLPPYVLTPDQIAAFLDKLALRRLRCELTVGDMQILMPEFDRQQAYYRARAEVTRHYAGVVDESCNEPFKNGVDVERLGHFSHGLQASGNYDLRTRADGTEFMPALLDFLTYHGPRKEEWPRTAKDALELYGGFPNFNGVKVPVVNDEGVGAGEELIPWSRSNVPVDFFDFAAVSGLYSAGATFHFTDGVYARVPGPIQAECARQFVYGLNSIALDAPFGRYTRGYLADCPLEHDDATALRTFGRILGSRAEVVVVRPTKQRADDRVARNGWRIVSIEGDRSNVVHLER